MSAANIQQAVVAAYAAVEERLLPARLSNTSANAFAIANHLKEHGLPLTPDGVYRAVNSLAFSLRWDVEPEKVKARKTNERPATIKSVEQALKPFLDAKRKGEAADAKANADKASINECKALIASFTPTRMTPRGSALDYAKQKRVQGSLTKSLEAAVAKKANLQAVTKAVAAEIQRQYSLEESSRERI